MFNDAIIKGQENYRNCNPIFSIHVDKKKTINEKLIATGNLAKIYGYLM